MVSRHLFSVFPVLLLLLFLPLQLAAQAKLYERKQELCRGIEAQVWVAASGANKKQVMSAINFALTGARESCAVVAEWSQRGETAALNQHAGDGPIPIGLDLQYLLPRVTQLAAATEGAFDPTAWSPKRSSYRDIWLDPSQRRAMLKKKQSRLSFRGILKGYLADRIAARLQSRGIKRYHVVVAGSAMKAEGRGAHSSWMTGIPDPHHQDRDSVCRVALVNRALVTVAAYSWDQSEESYPGSAAFASVTVLAPHAHQADALANAAMVLGPQATATIRSSPGAGAVLISHQGQVSTVGSVPAVCMR